MCNQSTALPHFYCLIYTSSNHIWCRLVEICEERKGTLRTSGTVSLSLNAITSSPKAIPAQRLNLKALQVCSSEGKPAEGEYKKVSFQVYRKGGANSCQSGNARNSSQTLSPGFYFFPLAHNPPPFGQQCF